ncbi:hypothetical protein EYF80_009969 [Liparis tanakae]|uniref:Uncharacterized protein n=1 Tax=Liparis tanakae TaxID=230148 RepID=A0A4Z2IRQ5_9TELE|nr:hypothetical protein EYF80_009969 [Liparis tanakae]
MHQRLPRDLEEQAKQRKMGRERKRKVLKPVMETRGRKSKRAIPDPIGGVGGAEQHSRKRAGDHPALCP